jgi:hypothetical protein
MGKFRLTHVTLYAKGWYRKSNDLLADLKHCLKVDYLVSALSKQDVAMILIHNLKDSDFGKTFKMGLDSMLNDISPENSYSVGYYHKDTPCLFSRVNEVSEPYDYWMAVIHTCLIRIQCMEREYWEIGMPDYDNVLPHLTDGCYKGQTKKTAYFRAKKMFEKQ